jgi:hypothetical protein
LGKVGLLSGSQEGMDEQPNLAGDWSDENESQNNTREQDLTENDHWTDKPRVVVEP